MVYFFNPIRQVGNPCDKQQIFQKIQKNLINTCLNSGLITLGGRLRHRHGRPIAQSPRKLVLRIPQQHVVNKRVQHDRQQQRDHVEENDVGEEEHQVLGGVPPQSKAALGDLPHALHAHGRRLGEQEPRRAVQHGERPTAQDDLLGPGDSADRLGLHGVADGDVPLHGESRERQGRRVDAQVLAINQ